MNQKTKKKLRNLKILLIGLITLVFGDIYAEELSVEVINLSSNSNFSWSISNDAGHIEYSSYDFSATDTFPMELLAEEKFHFNLTLDTVDERDTSLAILQVNGAAIMLIKGNLGVGEYSYPFFTGIKEPVLKIVGGSSASIADFPWQIFFSSGDYMCGGTIISKRWILTAAHCTQDGDDNPISYADMSVKVGSTNNSGSSGKWYDVKSYTIHKDYGKSGLVYDIAVLELYEDINFENAEVIELLSGQDVSDGATDPGVMSTVSGWGLVGVNPDQYTNVLQKVQLPIVSNATASSVWGNTSSTFLMAGYKNGNKDACSGDSGGPLVVDVDGTYKIAGIVSWGSEDCNTYGAFTRVSSYLDWIEEQTGVTIGGTMVKPQGDFEICQGTLTSSYSTSAATAGTYQWVLTPDSAGTVNFQDGEATVSWEPTFLGFAELKVRAELGGQISPWAISLIEVQQNTVIYSSSSDITVCEGEFVRFEVEAEGHELSYYWFKDSAFYRSSADGELSILFADTLDSGDYYCEVEGTCGELSSPMFHLAVYPNTVIESVTPDSKVIQNSDMRLSVVSRGLNLVYQWYKDDNAIVGASMPYLDILDVNATDIGQYFVEVMGTCNNDTSEYIYVYVDANSSDEVQARVWPSVIKSDLYTAISNNQEYQVEVYDFNGHIIFSQENAINQNYIDASAWIGGMYVLQITSQDILESFRILKK